MTMAAYGEFNRGQETDKDLLRNRDVRPDRNAHVPLDQILHVDKILVGIGPIESELFADPGDFLRGGEFAQEKMGGVSRNKPQHEKDQDGDPDQDKDKVKQTSGNESSQINLPVKQAKVRLRSRTKLQRSLILNSLLFLILFLLHLIQKTCHAELVSASRSFSIV